MNEKDWLGEEKRKKERKKGIQKGLDEKRKKGKKNHIYLIYMYKDD